MRSHRLHTQPRRPDSWRSRFRLLKDRRRKAHPHAYLIVGDVPQGDLLRQFEAVFEMKATLVEVTATTPVAMITDGVNSNRVYLFYVRGERCTTARDVRLLLERRRCPPELFQAVNRIYCHHDPIDLYALAA